jgi:hypothetical protein
VDYVLEKLPFQVEVIQTDHGPEFGSQFHYHVLDRGIGHAYIKPRTPRLNGKVERSHRIDAEEFYRMLQGVVIDNTGLFNERLQEWENLYNFSRPHGGLGGRRRMRDSGRRRGLGRERSPSVAHPAAKVQVRAVSGLKGPPITMVMRQAQLPALTQSGLDGVLDHPGAKRLVQRAEGGSVIDRENGGASLFGANPLGREAPKRGAAHGHQLVVCVSSRSTLAHMGLLRETTSTDRAGWTETDEMLTEDESRRCTALCSLPSWIHLASHRVQEAW